MNIDRKFALGVDFGTASVRTAVIRVKDGVEVSSATHIYRHGTEGCMFDPADPQVARQHPDDYTEGLAETIRKSLSDASRIEGFSLNGVIGLGFDTTGTSVLPVLRDGTPLALTEGFKSNLNANIWLWKDHSAWAEAEEITRKARESHPEYIGMVGGTYSSEWYWSKVYHCLNVDKEVFSAADTWMEVADWLLFTITGGTDTMKAIRGICAAGHKALYNADWGGYPAQDFIESVHPDLLR
jgi:L-ribulokinase